MTVNLKIEITEENEESINSTLDLIIDQIKSNISYGTNFSGMDSHENGNYSHAVSIEES